jgi:hypothetical protein
VARAGVRGPLPSPSPAHGLEPRPHPRSRVLPKPCPTRALLTCLGALLTWCATSRTLHRRRARGMQSSRGVKSGSCGPLITIRPESGPGMSSSSMLPRSMLAFGGMRLQPLLAWGLWLVASCCTCLVAHVLLASSSCSRASLLLRLYAATAERQATLRRPVRAALAAAATLLQVVSSADHGRDVCADSADQTETTSPASITEWFLNWYPQTQTEAVRPLECICEAGELLFVPRGLSSSFPPSRFPAPPLASLGAMSRARLSSVCPLFHGLALLSL